MSRAGGPARGRQRMQAALAALVGAAGVIAALALGPAAQAQPAPAQPAPAQPAPGDTPGTAAQPGDDRPGTGQPTQPAPAPPPGQGPTAPAPRGVPVAPPSGPGLGPPRPPAMTPVNVNPVQLTPKEKDELRKVEDDFDHFLKAADEHDHRMRAIARREYDARTSELQKRYADKIAKAEADRGRRHGDTVALLEKFLKNHPSHEQFTPDAMFRLADLYIDQADEDVEAQIAAQENAGPPAPGAPDAAALVADYSKATRLWEDILTRFPNYRQTPSTLYLLAYYGKSKDERRSLQVFLALACANKYKWNTPPGKPPTR
ncbi:MAG: hypothetical protein E6J90_05930, partial [Deltaproteobacteria bacterium]